jgi:hypothetical protein
MTGHLIKFITPDDVRDYRGRLDAVISATDTKVTTSCPGLDQGTREGWSKFVAAWREFLKEEPSWLHALAQYETTEAYEQDMSRWQDMISKASCLLPTPRVVPGSNEGPSSPPSSLESTLRTVAIAGAVVAVALGVKAVLR